MFPATIIIRRGFHIAATTYVRRRANPGIGIQTQVYRREGALQRDEEFQDFDELETDFMNVDKTHKQHEREMLLERDRIRRAIVKNKYFKEKAPNFLTYAEKEQIKFLHSSDPNEWTVEKLTESFPASPEIIKKVIQTKWVARSAKRIRKHDEAVIENWENFRNRGFPELPPMLREHLNKFAHRKKEDLQNYLSDWNPRPALPRPKRTDFLSLITSCKGYEDKESDQKNLPLLKSGADTQKKLPAASDEETYLSDKIRDKRNMRMKELQEFKLTDDSKAIVAPFDNPSGTGIVSSSSSFPEKYASDEIVVSRDDIRKFEMSNVKDKIYIPQKLRKKGATYKVDDCYYDDDGEFLYRVPGMTGRNV